MKDIYLAIPLLPLFGAIISGFFGKFIGRNLAHIQAIFFMTLSTALSFYVLYQHHILEIESFNETLYQWMKVGNLTLEVGFLIDNLTTLMMATVSFVSLMVHIYTIGYMKEDEGYTRFFSYISLFTFAMLMLVMSNNFLQLFFGWEAVGLVSYLLIGFWYQKPTAIFANLKAFLVNRVGDFGFLIGIAAIAYSFGTLRYDEVFAMAASYTENTISLGFTDVNLISFICICLFIGAMGKSAQVPLHVWLPDSMEGPTPISALIHAATMVTAGIFMVARTSYLFEYSDTALSFVLIIGSITALFMGILGMIQNDIKRIIAYSTLSQLGYMTIALGVSAYSAAIFHLFTHAFFKALLFLGAGSVIVALHHEQDIRKMGALFKKLPITATTMLIGSLALIGFPGFSGFFSKDLIIEAVHSSNQFGAEFALYAVMIGVFITAFYSFRLFFIVFMGKDNVDEHAKSHLHEPSKTITFPLIMLAIPSIVIGWLLIDGFVFSDYLNQNIFVLETHNVINQLKEEGMSAMHMLMHTPYSLPFYFALFGVICAYIFYIKKPHIPKALKDEFSDIHYVLENKYGFDWFNENILAKFIRTLGNQFFKYGDGVFIDGVLINGTSRMIGRFSKIIRVVQTGNVAGYTFVFILSILIFLLWNIYG